MHNITQHPSGSGTLRLLILFALAPLFVAMGCVEAKIDEHGLVQGSHVKAKELLEYVATCDREFLRKRPSHARCYVGVIEPGELSWYSSGTLPQPDGVDSAASYCISASADTIELAENAIVVRYVFPLGGPPSESFCHLQWCDERQTWRMRRAVGYDWKMPDGQFPTAISHDDTDSEKKALQPKKHWRWSDGRWREIPADLPDPSEEK